MLNSNLIGIPLYAKWQLAMKMRVVVPGFFPILFDFRGKPGQESDKVRSLAAINSSKPGGLDGTALLLRILEDGRLNQDCCLEIPKFLKIVDAGELCAIYYVTLLIFTFACRWDSV